MRLVFIEHIIRWGLRFYQGDNFDHWIEEQIKGNRFTDDFSQYFGKDSAKPFISKGAEEIASHLFIEGEAPKKGTQESIISEWDNDELFIPFIRRQISRLKIVEIMGIDESEDFQSIQKRYSFPDFQTEENELFFKAWGKCLNYFFHLSDPLSKRNKIYEIGDAGRGIEILKESDHLKKYRDSGLLSPRQQLQLQEQADAMKNDFRPGPYRDFNQIIEETIKIDKLLTDEKQAAKLSGEKLACADQACAIQQELEIELMESTVELEDQTPPPKTKAGAKPKPLTKKDIPDEVKKALKELTKNSPPTHWKTPKEMECRLGPPENQRVTRSNQNKIWGTVSYKNWTLGVCKNSGESYWWAKNSALQNSPTMYFINEENTY